MENASSETSSNQNLNASSKTIQLKTIASRLLRIVFILVVLSLIILSLSSNAYLFFLNNLLNEQILTSQKIEIAKQLQEIEIDKQLAEQMEKEKSMLDYDVDDFPTCKYQKSDLKHLYLETYTTKQGDTLLSIAQEQIGDKSRYTELFFYNSGDYPFLSKLDVNSPINPDLLLYLPPKWALKGQRIAVSSGNVVKVLKSTRWGVMGRNWWQTSFDIDFFQYDSGEIPKIGDCATILFNVGDKNIFEFVKQGEIDLKEKRIPKSILTVDNKTELLNLTPTEQQ